MNSKTAIFLAAFLAMTGTLNGCQTKTADIPSRTESENSEPVQTEASGVLVDMDGMNLEFTSGDMQTEYDETSAVKISLSQDNITISGDGASVEGAVLTVSRAGTYILSGTLDDGQVIVDAPDTEKVRIILDGVLIHSENSVPFYIRQADKVFLTLAEGTDNEISDGGAYRLDEEDSSVDAALFSKADLTINGQGSLTVNAGYQHGIVSKDDLVVTGGSLNINAAGGGLYGKDCVKISDGNFTIQAGRDGIQSDNEEDGTRGFVYIAGGSFKITAGNDAVQAETLLQIDDGVLEVTSGGGSANAVQKVKTSEGRGGRKMSLDGNLPPGGERMSREETALSAENTVSESQKGIKAGGQIVINGGTIAIDAADDAVHTNGSFIIDSGSLILATGDDGLHADSEVIIRGGDIQITKSYEGIEGTSVSINGGTVNLVSEDDGINASGAAACYIRITGGQITVDASGDGIDSNGSFYVDGGNMFIYGPEGAGNGAIDYDGKAVITGGLLIATGSAGMEQGFSDSSSQYSLLYQFTAPFEIGTTVTITSADGVELVKFDSLKRFQTMIVSMPEFRKDESYTITAGDQTETVTLSSVNTGNTADSTLGFQGRHRENMERKE